MLVAIGPGVQSLKDYTNRTDVNQIDWQANQGDTLDTLKLVINDPTSAATCAAEDDVILMDENDANGWPTVNLLKNGDFEGGSYTSGSNVIANFWGCSTLTGFSLAYDGTVGKYGPHSQKITFSNVANNTFWYYTQGIELPTDENGTFLRDQSYTASIWYLSGGLSGIGTVNITLEWWTNNFGTSLGGVTGSFGITLDKAGYNNWQRLYVNGTPPSNATEAKLTISATTTSGTNSGNLWFDGAQLERNTFGSLVRSNFPVPLFNPSMASSGRAGTNYVDDFKPDAGGADGTSWAVVSSPVLAPSTTAQQIAMTNGSGNSFTRAVAHDRIPINNGQNYTVSMLYQVTQSASATYGRHVPATAAIADSRMAGATGGITFSTATGARLPYASPAKARSVAASAALGTFTTTTNTRTVPSSAALAYTPGTAIIHSRIGVNTLSWDGANMNFVGNYDAQGPAFEPVSTGWQTLAFNIGPSTPYPMPSNVTHLKVYGGILAQGSEGNAENSLVNGSMTIVVGQVTIKPFPASGQPVSALQNATQAYVYPTPFVGGWVAGNASAGGSTTYYDKGDAYYYRQSRYFGGLARHIIYDYSASRERQVEVDATDYGVMLAEAPATFVLVKVADSAAIKQAGDYASNQGFLKGIDYTSFVNTLGTVDAMIFNWQTTRDVLTKLANQFVAAFWVDAYKQLHYTSALANTAPFALSDTPDNVNTFPMYGFKYDNDSTNTVTAPVIEGSTQISAPQTYTAVGYATTTSAAIASGANVTSISVNAVTGTIAAGNLVELKDVSGNIQDFVVASAVAASATSIPVQAQVATQAWASGTTIYTAGFVVNNSNPIAQIDSANPGSGQVTVGLISSNQYSQGYGALADLARGILWMANPNPANAATVTIVYRYAAPVIVRVHAPWAEVPSGKVRRKIHHHTKADYISSQKSAIDRANADLSTSSKAQPVGDIYIMSPPAPFTTGLQVGQAISVTHQATGLASTLMQIQSIDTTFHGNGVVVRQLKVGFYRPDFIIYQAQLQRESDQSTDNNNTVLQDVLTATDGWSITDHVVATTSNVYKWSSGSTTGAGIWGSNAGSGVWG